MKNNKLSFYFLVLLFSTAFTSVMAQDVSIVSPYTMCIGPVDGAAKGDPLGGVYTDGSTAGTKRLLVAMVMGEDNTTTVPAIKATAVTYGGVAMTLVTDVIMDAGTDTYLSMWILKEADLVTASGSTVAVTWSTTSGTCSGGGEVDCVIFNNVDQVMPIRSSSVGFAGTATVKTTADLTALAGEMIVAHGATGTGGSTYTWDNSFTEKLFGVGGFGRSLGATKDGSGAAEAVGYTGAAGQSRTVVIGAVIKKFGTSSLSIADNALAANAINVYPNPASDVINIDSNASSEKVIKVINSLGQVISTTKASGNARIDLKSLNASGFVIVQVIADGKVSNHKVIVK